MTKRCDVRRLKKLHEAIDEASNYQKYYYPVDAALCQRRRDMLRNLECEQVRPTACPVMHPGNLRTFLVGMYNAVRDVVQSLRQLGYWDARDPRDSTIRPGTRVRRLPSRPSTTTNATCCWRSPRFRSAATFASNNVPVRGVSVELRFLWISSSCRCARSVTDGTMRLQTAIPRRLHCGSPKTTFILGLPALWSLTRLPSGAGGSLRVLCIISAETPKICSEPTSTGYQWTQYGLFPVRASRCGTNIPECSYRPRSAGRNLRW